MSACIDWAAIFANLFFLAVAVFAVIGVAVVVVALRDG